MAHKTRELWGGRDAGEEPWCVRCRVMGIETGLVSFVYSFVPKNKFGEDRPLRKKDAPVYLKLLENQVKKAIKYEMDRG